MRRSAFSLAAVALAFTTSVASADDFSALLADLSFGDEPALNAPMSVAASKSTDELKPAPTGFVLPELDSVPSSVSLQDPVPVATIDSDQVDLDAAFSVQEMESAGDSVPAQSVGFPNHGCAAGQTDCAAGHAGCASDQASCDCESVTICRPRTQAVLPSSTLYQYFRSNKCYTNVWDGYRHECPKCHSHIHGECDCFSKKRNHGNDCGVILPAPACNDCRRCDSSCD